MGHSEGWCERGENGTQPWFTKELVGLQKQFLWADGLCVSCKSVDERSLGEINIWRRGGHSIGL